MKVGLIMPLAEQRGGAELMLIHLLRANKEQMRVDYQVVFLERGPMADTVRELGYPVTVMEAGRVRDLGKYMSVVWRLHQWLRREKIDIVLSWMSKAHLYVGPAAKLAGIQAIWWQHGAGTRSRLQKTIEAIPAQAVLCCSQATEQSQRANTPDQPMHIIYPAIHATEIDRALQYTSAEARSRLGLPEDRPIIGIAARLQRWKGVHVFLEAASRVLRTHPRAYFVIIGGEHFSERPYAEELRAQAAQPGLADQVHFAGHQTNPLLWMRAFDIVVHATVDFEPFGMVVIEGMALGKAVVATKSGGPEEIITDSVDGRLVAPGDAGELAQALESLLAAPDRRVELGRRGQERARHFHSRRLAEEVGRLLHQSKQDTQEVSGWRASL